MATAQRPFHVVIWGTTGCVGRLCAEHLTRDYQNKGVKWAMAGRNRQKLEDVRNDLSKINPTVKEIPIITADAADPSSLEKLTKQTKVVLATAGPFAKFGTSMVNACLQTSTNYCDITGEINWVRRMIREYDDAAKEKGIRIIHMAGFDSIPSDLGAFLVVDHIKKTYNKPTQEVDVLFSKLSGGLSGGTILSLFGALLDESGPDRKAVEDPYGLDPAHSSRGPDKPDSFWPGYSKLHQAWYMPFVMSPVNTRVVRRSNALLDHAYGKNFHYVEALKVPGRISAYLGSFLIVTMGLLFSISPLRSFWLKILPKPGQMPPEKTIKENGHWETLIAGIPEGDSSKVVKALCESRGGDPGYWSTSRMVLEAGLCIALQEDELKVSDNVQSGVLTPASALGHVLLKRLNAYNQMFSFKITEP